MAFNINRANVNFQCNLVDTAQFSNKTIEDYNIVSRKQLDKIVNSAERCLTEDEHRWLIKRDCKKVVSDLEKYTRRRLSKYVLREKRKEENTLKIPLCPTDQTVVDDDHVFNVIVENNFTVINVKQLNININNNNNSKNNNDCVMYEYNDRVEKKENSQVVITDLERLYWNKWRDYVKKKLSVKINKNEKIDSFLLKIQEKLNTKSVKSPIMHKMSNRVALKQSKTVYERQLEKIDNQKKLLDQQQKEIERLKLQQLRLESEKAMLENQKLMEKTYERSEKRLKIKNIPRKSCVIKASPSDLLNRMELRALERQAKWEAVKERRKQKEQEEHRKKQELEERCLKEQMEQKRKQLFEAREKLRLKKIEESKKKIEREILMENIKTAEDFYRKCLLKNGLEAFKTNLKNVRLQIQNATYFHDKKVLATCFSKWRFFVNNNLNEKIFLAEQFYKKKLLKTAFLSFYKILEENRKEEQVAEDWHNFKTQEFWFKKWLNYVKEMNTEMHKELLEAESYYNRTLIKRCFENWKKFSEIVYKERLKDCRLRMWHEKVQEIIPDFIPPKL